MMTGTIVKSKAGRDKDGLLIVLSVEDSYVVLADGRRRKLERPKRKKIKHVLSTGHRASVSREPGGKGRLVTETGKELTNRELRGILSCFAASQQEG